MKKVTVTVFGAYAPPCGDCDATPVIAGCSSCGTIDIMKKEAEHLQKLLEKNYSDIIEFNYVDVESEEIENYPGIKGILNRVNLPLTVLDGEPRFHGGLSAKKVSEAINEILKSTSS